MPKPYHMLGYSGEEDRHISVHVRLICFVGEIGGRITQYTKIQNDFREQRVL